VLPGRSIPFCWQAAHGAAGGDRAVGLGCDQVLITA
jgi:hypothetical protein